MRDQPFAEFVRNCGSHRSLLGAWLSVTLRRFRLLASLETRTGFPRCGLLLTVQPTLIAAGAGGSVAVLGATSLSRCGCESVVIPVYSAAHSCSLISASSQCS